MEPKEKEPFFTDYLKIATEKDTKLAWSGKPNGEWFRCGFCGYKIKAGDKYRIIYTNDIPGAGGNPIICENCDVPNDLARKLWKEKHQTIKELKKGAFWWFFRN